MYPFSARRLKFDVRQYAALLGVADVVCLGHPPDQLFGELSSHLFPVISFELLGLALLDSVRKIMKISWWEGSSAEPQTLEVGVDDSAVGSVCRNQTALAIEDLSAQKDFKAEKRWLGDHEICSYCVLPLTTVRGKLGAIGFGSKRTRGFDAGDIQFLQHVAEMVALGIDPTLSEAARAEEVGRLRLLIEVGSPYVPVSDLQGSVNSFLQSLQKWAVQDYVGIYVYDEVSQSLHLHTPNPALAEKMAPQGMVPLDETLAGKAFRGGRTTVFDYYSLAAAPLPSVKRGLELGVKSVFLSPLIADRRRVGVLKVARRNDRPFSVSDVALLEQVGATVAPIIERAGTASAREVGTEEAPAETKNNETLAYRTVVGRAGRLEDFPAAWGLDSARGGDSVSFTASEALMESENLLSAYFRASGVGLCILDESLRYLAVNRTLAEKNRLPAEEHLGKSIRQVVGDLAELLEPQLRRVFATGHPVLNLEISSTLPTRTEPGHWIEHFIPIKDAAGIVTEVGAIVVEVTEQKKLEESLRSVSDNLRQEKKRLYVLTEVSRVLAAKLNIPEVFPKISAYLRRILQHEYAALALHDEKTGRLVREVSDFPLRKLKAAENEILVEHPGAKAVREREMLILSRDEMKAFPGTTDQLLAEGLQSLCCVPLVRPKNSLGVLLLGSTRADAFKTDDLMLVNQVAAQLAIALENARTAVEVKQLRSRLGQEKRYLEGESRSHIDFEGVVGDSAALKFVLEQATVVAPSDATVLILGETGTGKSQIARAIHGGSKRKGRSFISLNCAAIPTGLLESELFGHEKGAFTGAVSQKIGRMELADKGTLFLDEVGEIPLELQPKLLRVLQDHEFERLGGTRTIKVDMRLIAATNRDLARSVAGKEFRSDLFYRLNVFPIRMPSLRERREDIPLLVRYFVQKFARLLNKEIDSVSSETMDAMLRWSWPGNVRELENFVERSVILTEGRALRAPLAEFMLENSGSSEPSLEESEREHILRVLRETGGVISGPRGAANRLGLKRTTLQSKMERLGIARKDNSGDETE